MAELKINPQITKESELVTKDREYECVKWMSIGKASVAIADVLCMDEIMPWQVEGLRMAQECIKEYSCFVDMLASNKLLLKEEA